MKELDVVRLKEDFKSIPAGTNGTIVLEYDGHCYEVEFVDDEGRTVAMPSLLPEQITDYIPPE